ncbi:MAG: hypothetical protein ACLQVY_21220 [Limisphaerales bacterium]
MLDPRHPAAVDGVQDLESIVQQLANFTPFLCGLLLFLLHIGIKQLHVCYMKEIPAAPDCANAACIHTPRMTPRKAMKDAK